MPDQPARPSAEEKESAVARLSAAFADDRVTLEEFERRVEEVYKAATPMALAKLTSDLPAPKPAGIDEKRQMIVDAVAARAAMPPRLFTAFGNIERSGHLTVPPHLEIRARFSNVELDLSDAELQPGVTEIVVRAFCGNVEVKLPAGVRVEHHGGALLGSFTAKVGTVVTTGNLHTVRVVGRAVLSNVEFTGAGG